MRGHTLVYVDAGEGAEGYQHSFCRELDCNYAYLDQYRYVFAGLSAQGYGDPPDGIMFDQADAVSGLADGDPHSHWALFFAISTSTRVNSGSFNHAQCFNAF